MEPFLLPVVRQFFPGADRWEAVPHGEGHINDTYRLTVWNRGGAELYLLQRLNRNVFPDPGPVMTNLLRVAVHLARFPDQGCRLQPRLTTGGDLWHEDAAGEVWRVLPFFGGVFSPRRVENPGQAREAARVIGRFLYCLFSLPAGDVQVTIPGFHDSLLRMARYRQAIAADAARRLARVEPEAAFLLEEQGLFQQVMGLPLPRRVVHNDAKINNVLFDAATGRARCLIDWDTIMPGILLSDFGDLVRSSVAPVTEDHADLARLSPDLAVFSALCEGFIPELREEATPEELEHLVTGALWITLEQAMRFLTDFLEGDVYYKVNYPDHNLIRTRNQLALYRSLRRRERELETIARKYR